MNPEDIELTEGDFDKLSRAAYRAFRRAGVPVDEARDESTSFAYAAAEILRERIADAKVSAALAEAKSRDTHSVVAQEHNRRVARNAR